MRVSIHPEDSGYANFTGSERVTVDGVDVTDRCQTADEELGIAYCIVLDTDGKPLIDVFTRGATRTEIKGLVEITKVGA